MERTMGVNFHLIDGPIPVENQTQPRLITRWLWFSNLLTTRCCPVFWMEVHPHVFCSNASKYLPACGQNKLSRIMDSIKRVHEPSFLLPHPPNGWVVILVFLVSLYWDLINQTYQTANEMDMTTVWIVSWSAMHDIRLVYWLFFSFS